MSCTNLKKKWKGNQITYTQLGCQKVAENNIILQKNGGHIIWVHISSVSQVKTGDRQKIPTITKKTCITSPQRIAKIMCGKL